MPNIPSTTDSNDGPQVINLTQARVDSAAAELVRMHQSTARRVEAGEVELHQSAAVAIKAEKTSSFESAVGLIHAEAVTLNNSGAAVVRAGTLEAKGPLGLAAADAVRMTNTYAGVVAGRHVQGERIETLVLLGGRVEGEVHTMMDARAALLAGMVGGLFAGLMLLLGRALFHRK